MPEPDTGTKLTWKVEGKRAQRPTNRSGPFWKEYTSKVLGLESHIFDVGNAKYTANFQKSVDAIAIHIQREYKGIPDIANAIRDLVLPSMSLPPYPTGTSGNPPDRGEIYLRQVSLRQINASFSLRKIRRRRTR
jgi:hypothetical protein